jgi:hypothetical protein
MPTDDEIVDLLRLIQFRLMKNNFDSLDDNFHFSQENFTKLSANATIDWE